MNQRDRLIEILKVPIHPKIGVDPAEVVADYLLENGVIVPPCVIGQKVYYPSFDEESSWIDEYTVSYCYCSSKGVNRFFATLGTASLTFRPKDIGKTVFLTKEEAEAKLKECEG